MLKNWLQAILTLSETFGVSFRDFLAIISRILEAGLPPDICDEVEIRTWIGKIGVVAADIADLTETTADDQLAAFCATIVSNDDTWAIAYRLLKLIDDGDHDGPDDVALERISFAMPEGSGLSPSLILAIVTLIWKIIDSLRE